MANFARIKPTYVSLSIVNNGLSADTGGPYDEAGAGNGYVHATVADGTIKAAVFETYNNPVIDKASDYVCAIERMEVSLNGIPFFDAGVGNVSNIIIRSRINPALFTSKAVVNSAYNLSHLLNILSSYYYPDPNNQPDGLFNLEFSLESTGHIRVDIDSNSGITFDQIQLEFPRRLNLILGLSTTQQINTNGALNQYTFAYSLIPRMDVGDDLQRIAITSNLPTNSDRIGNVQLPVLTDIGVETGSGYSNNFEFIAGQYDNTSWSMPLRDKLVYIPTEKRYLDLLGDFPITNIQIGCYYVNLDEQFKQVLIPFGGIFSIKIGFYLKQ